MVLPDAAGTAHLHHARELLHAGHGALQVAVTVVFQASALSVRTRRLLSAHRGAPAVMHAAHFVQMVHLLVWRVRVLRFLAHWILADGRHVSHQLGSSHLRATAACRIARRISPRTQPETLFCCHPTAGDSTLNPHFSPDPSPPWGMSVARTESAMPSAFPTSPAYCITPTATCAPSRGPWATMPTL